MFRFSGLLLCCVLVGCQGPKPAEMPEAHTVTEELRIQVDPTQNEERLNFTLTHHTFKEDAGQMGKHGRKSNFAVTIEPSNWVRVKRSGVLVGYSSETECLLDGEMVKVSGMPGDNFSVKVEPLARGRYRVIGIFLASRMTQSGELGKTISFDYVAEPGKEITVYRKTTQFDPEGRLGSEQLVRKTAL